MTRVVVDAIVARQITESQGSIEIVGPNGETLGSMERIHFTSEEIREAEQRLKKPGPWYTIEEVLERIQAGESP